MTTLTQARWRALGTYVELATADATKLAEAQGLAEGVLARVDAAASRFRADSDLARANRTPGTWVPVGSVLLAATEAALAVARATDGLVTPLLGRTLVTLGYDRSFADLPGVTPRGRLAPADADAWTRLDLDPAGRIRVPEGHSLDLGSTAKAWAADLIAEEVAERLDTSVIVSLGGDIRVADAPGDEQRWPIALSEHPDAPADAHVTIGAGGLATSSTVVRRWLAGAEVRHHVIDPRTSRPSSGPWRSVTATGPSALAANAASLAALILGSDALAWLHGRDVAARLVGQSGDVTMTASWDEGVQRV